MAAPLLLILCSDWAKTAGGWLDVPGETAGGGPTDPRISSRLPSALIHWIRLGVVKDPARAADKAAACYGGDASALLDVCRCRLVFDSAAGLGACLALTARSSHVRVVRVRSTLRPGRAAGRGGFRAVVLNVLLLADAARDLGLDRHVCEVQLVLRATADALRAADHGRYRELRVLCALQAEAAGTGPIGWGHLLGVSGRGLGGWFVGGAILPAGSVVDDLIAKDIDAPAVRLSISCAGEVPAHGRSGPSSFPSSAAASRVAWAADPLPRSSSGSRPEGCGDQGSEPRMPYGPPGPEEASLNPMHENALSQRSWLSRLVLGRNESVAIDQEQTLTDRALHEEILLAARRVFLKFSLGHGAGLDKQASNFEQALHASGSLSALFSSKPFAAYAAKRIGRVRTLLLFLCWTGLWAYFFQLVVSNGCGDLDHKWIRILPSGPLLANSHSQMNTSVEGSMFRQLGLLQDGCNMSVAVLTGDEKFMAGKTAAANGYYFAMNGTIPSTWALEVSDDSNIWRPVGVCSWVTVQVSKDGGQSWESSADGSMSSFVDCYSGQLSPGLESVIPGQDDLQVRVDFRPDIPTIAISIGFFVMPLGWLCGLIAALKGWCASFKLCLIIPLATFAVWVVFWSLLACALGSSWQKAIYLLLAWFTVPSIFNTITMVYFERHLVFIFLFNGILDLAQSLVICNLLDSKLDLLFLEAHTLVSFVIGAYLFSGSVLFYYLRRRVLQKSQNLLSDDQKKYDELWKETLHTNLIQISLLKQKIEEQRLLKRHKKCTIPPRQTVLVAEKGFLIHLSAFQRTYGIIKTIITHWYHSKATLSRTISERRDSTLEVCTPNLTSSSRIIRRPLQSLDKLYVQALCLEPILLHKVKSWADSCSGCFPCAKTSDLVVFERYSDIEMSQRSTIKWARLKSTQRTIEKVIRCYGQDASRVLDVCRQSIVFKTVHDLLVCFSVIAADPDVEIVRIRNRYDTEYDSNLSFGYRDVNINLFFRSRSAVQLSVEAHVCEVQLILQSVAELKNGEGHGNYVICRNLRAE